MPRLEDKLSAWIEEWLDEAVDEEAGEHYDIDVSVRYIAESDTRTRLMILCDLMLYAAEGFEHMLVTCLMDRPDKTTIYASMEISLDMLREKAGAAASLREVEDILEGLDDDDEDDD